MAKKLSLHTQLQLKILEIDTAIARAHGLGSDLTALSADDFERVVSNRKMKLSILEENLEEGELDYESDLDELLQEYVAIKRQMRT